MRQPLLLFSTLALACTAPQDTPEPRPPSASQVRPLDPRPGAAGMGDPYYPDLGNGGYDVRRYELDLDVEPEEGHLEAVARLDLIPTHDLSSFHLDLVGLEVHRVEIDGAEVAFEREGRELVLTPPEPLRSGARTRVEVHYSGIPSPVPDPGIPFIDGVGWMKADSGIHVMSEVVGAASWFPCNDHPRDKATFRFRVTVPAEVVAAANGRLLSEVVADGKRTLVFEASDPMATYLATLNVGDFLRLESEGPRGLPVTSYLPRDATEEEKELFSRQGEMVTFLETLFGPYPFEAIGAVVSYERLPGALETQTLSVYGRGLPEGVVVHELAHQWFGNCVSPANWKDLWLNEGFASYAEWLWTEHSRGSEALTAQAKAVHSMLRRNKVGSPVDPGLAELFGPRSYVRGAYSLHRLRLELGDEAFFRLLQTWVETFHDAHASTEDFVALAEKVAGRDLDTFFEEWVYSEVVPEDS